MMNEIFTITATIPNEPDHVWTRGTMGAAIGLADNITRRENVVAKVTLTETGKLYYESTPLQKLGKW